MQFQFQKQTTRGYFRLPVQVFQNSKIIYICLKTISLFLKNSHSVLFSVQNTQWVRKEAPLTKFRYLG